MTRELTLKNSLYIIIFKYLSFSFSQEYGIESVVSSCAFSFEIYNFETDCHKYKTLSYPYLSQSSIKSFFLNLWNLNFFQR